MKRLYQKLQSPAVQIGLLFGLAMACTFLGYDTLSAIPVVGAAVVAVKSSAITAMDTTGAITPVNAFLHGARVRHARGVASAANGDSIASTYRFCRIRSSDLVSKVLLDNASWGAACTMDIGIYKTLKDGGAVVDADLFASAIDMNTANRALDVTRESGVITVANMEKRVWELAGLSSDPQIEYDVTGTLVAAAAAAGAACVQVEVVGAA